MQVHPYLNFDGQCAEAFTFYERVLGGKIEAMFPFGDTAAIEHVPSIFQDKIMHARLVAGDQVLMASDAPPGMYQKPQGLYVSLQVEKPADAQRVFDALVENGTVSMPFEKTFWAAGGFGMLVDRFGIPWMVNCEQES